MAHEEELCVLEGLTRVGVLGIGRYSGHLSVKSIVNGEGSSELHFKTISYLCKLLLVKAQTQE